MYSENVLGTRDPKFIPNRSQLHQVISLLGKFGIIDKKEKERLDATVEKIRFDQNGSPIFDTNGEPIVISYDIKRIGSLPFLERVGENDECAKRQHIKIFPAGSDIEGEFGFTIANSDLRQATLIDYEWKIQEEMKQEKTLQKLCAELKKGLGITFETARTFH
ncbi:MAG: hypothetical protein Q6373_020675 [Candidatus Sigynarchaeota archaeon]